MPSRWPLRQFSPSVRVTPWSVIVALVMVGGCQRADVPTSTSTAHTGTSAEAPATTTSRPVLSGTANSGTPARSQSLRKSHQLTPDEQVAQVTVDFSAQVDSVRHAQENGQLARLSINGRPTPFDPKRYRADPHSYLSVIEPCRIWQSAEPGPDVDALVDPEGRQQIMVAVPSGEVRPLTVKTWPGYPASFTSTGRGAFQNGLDAITVQADERGFATAHFTATPGTTDEVRILAASPVVAGAVSFLVTISTP